MTRSHYMICEITKGYRVCIFALHLSAISRKRFVFMKLCIISKIVKLIT